MKRRQFVLLLGAGGAAASSVGSGAFSSVEAERGVEVNVVGDENAYLGINQVEHQVFGEETVVRITNQFAASLDLTVALCKTSNNITAITVNGITSSEELHSSDDSTEVSLGIGKPAEIKVECGDSGDAEFTLLLKGEIGDDGGTVKTTRKFDITCDVVETDVAKSTNNSSDPSESPGDGPPEHSQSGGNGPPEHSQSGGNGPPEHSQSDSDRDSSRSAGGNSGDTDEEDDDDAEND